VKLVPQDSELNALRILAAIARHGVNLFPLYSDDTLAVYAHYVPNQDTVRIAIIFRNSGVAVEASTYHGSEFLPDEEFLGKLRLLL